MSCVPHTLTVILIFLLILTLLRLDHIPRYQSLYEVFPSHSSLRLYCFSNFGDKEIYVKCNLLLLSLSASICMDINKIGLVSALINILRYIMNEVSHFIHVYGDLYDKIWCVSSLSFKLKKASSYCAVFLPRYIFMYSNILLSIYIYTS